LVRTARPNRRALGPHVALTLALAALGSASEIGAWFLVPAAHESGARRLVTR
jgi:hypothetical protein